MLEHIVYKPVLVVFLVPLVLVDVYAHLFVHRQKLIRFIVLLESFGVLLLVESLAVKLVAVFLRFDKLVDLGEFLFHIKEIALLLLFLNSKVN